MRKLFEFICHYCSYGKYRQDILKEMNKVNVRMLPEADEDIKLFEKLLIDKEENKHQTAKWVVGEEYEYATCSECGYMRWGGFDSRNEAKMFISTFALLHPFCEGCGAKMIGVDE